MGEQYCRELRSCLQGELLEEEPLSKHTSLKVGGAAQFFAMPVVVEELQELLKICSKWKVPWAVIGGGYNLLVRDGGLRGVVISLKKLDKIEQIDKKLVRVMAGSNNHRFLGFLKDAGLSGLEFLAGIPGTIGGAVAMNAGCHGHEIMEAVESLTLLDENGCSEVCYEELDFGYRFLRIGDRKVIAAATFRFTADRPETVSARVAEYLEKRQASQQVGFPNAGSFFKNPEGFEAWKLIDAAGMRGTQIGGAQVSEVHANFLVNRGGAVAADFLELAALIKKTVKGKSGIDLEEEVRIIGEDRVLQ